MIIPISKEDNLTEQNRFCNGKAVRGLSGWTICSKITGMVTKRALGILLSAGGFLVVLALLAVDLLEAGEYQGIGPAQQLGLVVGGAVLLLGLTLIPLGDRPA